MYKHTQNRDRSLKVSYGVSFEPRVPIGTFQFEYFASGAERECRLVDQDQNGTFGKDEVSFYLYDHLGNTRVTYTPTGFIAHPESPSVCVNKVNSVMDYFPYGKVLRHYNVTDERYLTTQHERDQETDLDYRGARYYDNEVGRFLSLDPHAANYPSFSDYSYVANNPIIFIDPDGKDIIFSDAFKKSDYYGLFLYLQGNNSVFKSMLSGFTKTDFDLTLKSTDIGVPVTNNAYTEYIRTVGITMDDSRVVVSIDAEIKLRPSSGPKLNKLGKLVLLSHELIHAYIGLQPNSPEGSDASHEVWTEEIGKMEAVLKEYNSEKKIGLTNIEITELSIFNCGKDSTPYVDYVQSLATKNGTTYDKEQAAYNTRINKLTSSN